MRFLENFEFDLINKDEQKRNPTNRDNRSRLLLGYLFLLLLMIVLVFRMGHWQIIKADELKEKALAMQKMDTEIEPTRGSIYDSRMNVLAETATEYELYAYSQYLYKDSEIDETEKEVVLNNLVKITGEEKSDLKKKLEGKENLVLLADGLTKEEVDKAEKLWDSNVMVQVKTSRTYPNGAFAAQMLGGVDDDNVGRSGLEYEYNTELAGIKGRTVKTTDNAGNTLANGNAKYYQAEDGYNLVTSIDSVIQHYAEDALNDGMRRTGAQRITCIVMEPKTGEVLAIAQTPEFDPNNSSRPSNDTEYQAFKRMSDKQQSEYLSRMWTLGAISSVYEPGSTYKLIAAASALESGHATMNSTYYCGGAINVEGITLHCLGHHGSQPLIEAVAHSCNSAFARVALDMGANTYYNYIDLFGFRDSTDIDLPGETTSIVKDPATMGRVDLATTGYGQGIAITPIQMLCAVNAIGNGGYLMQPRIVNKIVDNKGKTIKKFDNVTVRQVISKETSDLMREIMEYYPTQIGGQYAYVPGYRVGGKTGTANIAENGEYTDYTDCSYVAMAPMDDPKVSVIVIANKPTKTVYGNQTAGPIVKEILEKSLTYLGVERKYTDKEAAAAKKDLVSVPKVKGMDSKKAVKLLTSKKLKYQYVPDNNGDKSFIVADQYPKSGTKVKKNSVIYLYSE